MLWWRYNIITLYIYYIYIYIYIYIYNIYNIYIIIYKYMYNTCYAVFNIMFSWLYEIFFFEDYSQNENEELKRILVPKIQLQCLWL